MYVAARSLRCRPVLAASQRRRRGLQLPGALGQPVAVVGPPAAPLDVGVRHPVRGLIRGIVDDPMAGAALGAWRVAQRLDVAAGREGEALGATEQLRAAVRVLPRNDVVV